MLEMYTHLVKKIRDKQYTDRLIIVSLSGLIAFISGAFTSAALMFIILRLALMAAGDRYEGAVKMAQTRMELTYLNKYTLKPEDKPVLDLRLYKLLDNT
jgi:hypothetical protein